jgi:hypothetical protein
MVMRSVLGLLIVGLLAGGLLSGCGAMNPVNVSKAGWTAEQEAVQSSVMSDPEVVDDGLVESEATYGVHSRPSASPLAAIVPNQWWRTIMSVERRFEITFADSDSTGRPREARVVLYKTMHGTLTVMPVPVPPETTLTLALRPMPVPGPGDGPAGAWKKPTLDRWERRLLLRRYPRPDSVTGAWKEWYVVGASGALVTSVGSNTGSGSAPQIVSVRFQSPNSDVTLTDPLKLQPLDGALRVDEGADVAVTATTGSVDDVVVLMLQDVRLSLQPRGDGTYVGVWRTPMLTGLRHVGVNALSHETLYDDQAAYRSAAWVFHYANRGDVIVANTP